MTLDELEPGTTYYIRAYATSQVGTTYSEVFTFTAAEAKAPTLSAVTQTASANFSVSVKATITDAGTSAVTRSGFCWSTTNQTPTTNDSVKELSGTEMATTWEALQPGTTYYIRAFAVNEFGTAYSEVFTFTAAEAKAPTLSVITQTASANFSVSIQASVTDAGTSAVTRSGFCWSTTNQTPTLDDSTMELEGPALAMTLDNLEPSTTYYIRAYAGNEVGTTYSEVFTFKVCYSVVNVTRDGDRVDLEFASVTSQGLSKVLDGCERAVVFAATVGLGVDRLIARYQTYAPSKALMLQAIGTERIEALCDAFCREIAREYKAVRPRFSAGYGDLPLELQRDIFRVLDCQRRIGLTLNESLLMSPSKSVTAIIGVR
jgi:hypothetical protein